MYILYILYILFPINLSELYYNFSYSTILVYYIFLEYYLILLICNDFIDNLVTLIMIIYLYIFCQDKISAKILI